MDSLIGTTLGQYQIIEEIGHGGMATVYKAYQPSLNRFVALKVLPDHLAHDATFVTRFIREAHIAEALKHPNIIEIIEISRSDPYFIAMQLIEGETLTSLIRRDHILLPSRTAQILLQIASALDYAHARGVIHRDVKPSNIMLDRSGNAILTDFGIAKAVEGTRLTQTGGFMGTPEYVAPEQIRGLAVDARADVYALGIVCYELLAGRVPFQGDTLRVLHAQAYEPPPPLRSINPRVPFAVEQIVARALAKDPARRYGRAGEFVNKLHDAVIGKTINSSAPGDKTRFIVTQPSPRTQTRFFAVVGTAIALVVLFTAFLLIARIGNPSGLASDNVPATAPISATSLVQRVAEIAPSPSATWTAVPTNTPIPTSTSTRVPPTPTLGVGATLVAQKDHSVMLYVPASEFTMGSDDGYPEEKPMHSVYLDTYWMDKYEVTNRQYRLCVEESNCQPPISFSYTRRSYFDDPQFDNYPVIFVSWNDADAYCVWANRHLPTEAEWEKAGRGTDRRAYPWGNNFDKSFLDSLESGIGDTVAVGSYPTKSSPYGIEDMAGNVWEWVADWYDSNYFVTSPTRNPKGPTTGQFRVIRGGGWSSNQKAVRVTTRDLALPNLENYFTGFRCAQ